MDLVEKIQILTDAAKYDVSCSSSNSNRKNKGGLGSGHMAGICHSWSEDGRCISLLKILMTNICIYNCEYCVNRASSQNKKAIFTPQEIADLTVNFYKRNYIEGLFLSSAVIKSPDYTMELLIKVAEILRFEKNFYGYIHMKAIPGADDLLIKKLGSLIDRMSINIELPTERSLKLLAPEKSYKDIYRPMQKVEDFILENREDRRKYKSSPKFVPAGQTSQMIIGASRENDLDIMTRAQGLYDDFALKRVYYSAFVPAVKSKLTEGIVAPPLLREHRIYQADWLLRFYGFRAQDILNKNNPNLDLQIDPKASWAINNLENFPLEINKATYDQLIRVPGIGKVYANRIIQARKYANLTYDSLAQLKISTKRAKNFILVGGKYQGINYKDPDDLRAYMANADTDNKTQLSFLGD